MPWYPQILYRCCASLQDLRVSLCREFGFVQLNSLVFSYGKLLGSISRQCRVTHFHRSSGVESFLKTFVVVKMDVFVDGGSELCLIAEFGQIVHLRFQNTPEAFCRAVINAMTDSGHGLLHFPSIYSSTLAIIHSALCFFCDIKNPLK